MRKFYTPKHKRKSLVAAGTPPPPQKREYIAVSFQSIDFTQGQKLEEWAADGLLVPAVERLISLCKMTYGEAAANRASCLSMYDGFPPKDKTDFFHPRHISNDVHWCSFHVAGKTCFAGHYDEIENIFYIVFLDAQHRFWIVEQSHT